MHTNLLYATISGDYQFGDFFKKCVPVLSFQTPSLFNSFYVTVLPDCDVVCCINVLFFTYLISFDCVCCWSLHLLTVKKTKYI